MGIAIRKGFVENKPIREAFLRSGLTSADVARYCDWLCDKADGPCADDSRVERMLGLRQGKSKGKPYYYQSMKEDNALKIIEAIGLDPVDFREIGL